MDLRTRSRGIPKLGRAAAAGKPWPAAGQRPGRQECQRIFSIACTPIGGRSLAIWTARGELLADTGDAFERITAAAVPAFFNVPDDSNRFDQTSPGRGPEPEALAVGKIGSRNYVFVGFERIGGVMVYDITDPRHPHFEQYINNRNFAIDPATVCEKGKPKSSACASVGDLSVEGLLFIPADSSPDGKPLLVVSHETSDSVTVFGIDPAS